MARQAEQSGSVDPGLAAGRGAGASKIERLLRQCVHAIATGRWRPGEQLPSLRKAEQCWGLGRLTVLGAYRRLVEMGLVQALGRSGFYVADGPDTRRLTRHRIELRHLYETIQGLLARETDLSPLGTLRYLAGLAESETAEKPEAAFVECTAHEAKLFASQISARLNVPCLALTTCEVLQRSLRVPSHVRSVFTTAYHREELEGLADREAPSLMVVPIEFSRELEAPLAQASSVSILGISPLVNEQMAADAGKLIGLAAKRIGTELIAPSDVATTLGRRLAPPKGQNPVLLLSPTLWEATPARWRAHRSVLPARYDIRSDAMPRIADTLGLPLGTPA